MTTTEIPSTYKIKDRKHVTFSHVYDFCHTKFHNRNIVQTRAILKNKRMSKTRGKILCLGYLAINDRKGALVKLLCTSPNRLLLSNQDKGDVPLVWLILLLFLLALVCTTSLLSYRCMKRVPINDYKLFEGAGSELQIKSGMECYIL